jgi:hypothetical protein
MFDELIQFACVRKSIIHLLIRDDFCYILKKLSSLNWNKRFGVCFLFTFWGEGSDCGV